MTDNFLAGELSSYKRKLASLRDAELADFLKDLIRRDRLHQELVPEIAKAVTNCPYYFPSGVLVDIIISTKSTYLQSQWEARIVEDTMSDGAFKLMRACPTESLERALCHRLTTTLGDLRLVFYKPILEVLAEKGGAYSLETIESLLFELEPEGKVADSVAQAILSNIDCGSAGLSSEPTDSQVEGLLNNMELSLLIAPLKTARDALRARIIFENKIVPVYLTITNEARKALKRGGQRLQEAREEFGIGRRDSSITQCRRAAEAFCKAVWWVKYENGSMDEKPLEDIKQALKAKKSLPESIEKAVAIVQQYSVFGAHDKVYEDTPLSDKVLNACISETEKLSDWATRIVDERDLDILT